MNKITIISLDKKFDGFENKIKRTAVAVLKILKKDKNIAEIYLIGNRRMKPLNKKFRGKDKPTNILSFQEPSGFVSPQKLAKLGEIYLNLEMTGDFWSKKVLRQASADAKAVADRQDITGETGKEGFLSIERLVIHGIIHLLGYTHEKESDRIKMEKLEHKVLKQITSTKHQITNNIK